MLEKELEHSDLIQKNEPVILYNLRNFVSNELEKNVYSEKPNPTHKPTFLPKVLQFS